MFGAANPVFTRAVLVDQEFDLLDPHVREFAEQT